MRNWREIKETGEIAVPKTSFRAWAARNCYSIMFLLLLFSITWLLQWILT